jgi:hypothetical protein
MSRIEYTEEPLMGERLSPYDVLNRVRDVVQGIADGTTDEEAERAADYLLEVVFCRADPTWEAPWSWVVGMLNAHGYDQIRTPEDLVQTLENR